MAIVEKIGEVTPEDLVRRAHAMAPMVRERAEAAEQNRVIAPEIGGGFGLSAAFRFGYRDGEEEG